MSTARVRSGLMRFACAMALLFGACLAPRLVQAAVFDHWHAGWNELLHAHVLWNAQGTATSVDYATLKGNRTALDAYLAELSDVDEAQFNGWSKDDRLAFLINAYNAYTVALILGRYPDLTSIKDLGGLLSSPWKQRFFKLLGAQRSLDEVEHGLIRAAPGFDEARVHFALNCASIGCPALRPEAYLGATLDEQLNNQVRRFLKDRSRNRYDAKAGRAIVSRLFDWYAKDFKAGHRGIRSVAAFLAQYADALGDHDAARRAIATGAFSLAYTDYDWRLNDASVRRVAQPIPQHHGNSNGRPSGRTPPAPAGR